MKRKGYMKKIAKLKRSGFFSYYLAPTYLLEFIRSWISVRYLNKITDLVIELNIFAIYN